MRESSTKIWCPRSAICRNEKMPSVRRWTAHAGGSAHPPAAPANHKVNRVNVAVVERMIGNIDGLVDAGKKWNRKCLQKATPVARAIDRGNEDVVLRRARPKRALPQQEDADRTHYPRWLPPGGNSQYTPARRTGGTHSEMSSWQPSPKSRGPHTSARISSIVTSVAHMMPTLTE